MKYPIMHSTRNLLSILLLSTICTDASMSLVPQSRSTSSSTSPSSPGIPNKSSQFGTKTILNQPFRRKTRTINTGDENGSGQSSTKLESATVMDGDSSWNSNSNSNSNSDTAQSENKSLLITNKLEPSVEAYTSPSTSTSTSTSGAVSVSLTTTEENAKKQSMASATFNLVKANLGSGVLALPAGIATFGDVPSAIIPAALLMCVLGSFSAYTFNMIPRLTRLDPASASTSASASASMSKNTKIMSISQAWEKEVGKESAWIVSLCCFLTPLGTALTFSIVLGDMLSMLAKSIGLRGIMASRQALLLAITTSTLYPLCNLKSLAALSPVSMVGVAGMGLTALFMVLRALPISPYFAAVSQSPFLQSIPVSSRPSFGAIGNNALSPSILVLVSMCATSLLVHFSAHDFCDDLENNTPQRFRKLTSMGFSLTVLMNVIIMGAGFLTFGGACQSMVLNNYSPSDFGATVSRFIVAVSLVGSYPIIFRAIKSSLFELTHKGKEVSDKFNKFATMSILGFLTSVALVLKDAGVVVSLNGAVMGSAIIYAFPSIIFLKLTSRLLSEGNIEKTKKLMVERFANKCLIGSGSLIAVCGASVILLNKFKPGFL